MNTRPKYLISVVGPTAIGKTALSIKLAQYFNTEIISSDSRQFFKEMKIGTAVPSDDELQLVKHHFIQHKSIRDFYSVGDFERDAIAKLSELYSTHDIVIMVGGSGLYVNAVINGLDEFPDVPEAVRAGLNETFEKEGITPLQNRLKELDPEHYQKVDIHNPQRVIRALEVCLASGKPYSSFLAQKKTDRTFKTISIGLNADRSVIYNRINQRVDVMVSEGLLEEAGALYKHKELNALQTVGYKELFNYMDGTWSLDFAISEIKKNTRRFAKRQLTWFKKNENTIWFDYKTPIEDIILRIDDEMKT